MKILSKACTALNYENNGKFIFYALFSLGLNKKYGDESQTACVYKNGYYPALSINEKYFKSLSLEKQIGLLIHEILHIALFHIFVNRLTYPKAKLLNIAMDIVVNQQIDDRYLPNGGVTLKYINNQFKLSLEASKGFDYYYKELDKESESNKDLSNFINDFEITHNFNDFNKYDVSSEIIENNINGLLKSTGEEVSKNKNNSNQWGNLPENLIDKIKELINRQPYFNWKAYLRNFVQKSIKYYIKKTRRKESDRFIDAPGLKIKKKGKLLISVDTSGSVNNDELQNFFTEINHIKKTGFDIDVIEVDTEIKNKFEYKGPFNIEVKGRGGTYFTPAIEYYNENRDKYTTFIYFTDGYAETPPEPLNSMLWIITSSGNENAIKNLKNSKWFKIPK